MWLLVTMIAIGIVLALPRDVASRRRDRRETMARCVAPPLVTAPVRPEQRFPNPVELSERDQAFREEIDRVVTRARASGQWRAAQAYARGKYRGAALRLMSPALAQAEIAEIDAQSAPKAAPARTPSRTRQAYEAGRQGAAPRVSRPARRRHDAPTCAKYRDEAAEGEI